jgi:hypothetical protein
MTSLNQGGQPTPTQSLAKVLLVVLATSSQVACASAGFGKSLGEQSSGYGYVPLDGLSVQSSYGDSCPANPTPADWLPLLEALPDLSVRYSVADYEPSGSLSFGPAKITTKDQLYRAVLDYVNVDSVPALFYAREIVGHHPNINNVELSRRGSLATQDVDGTYYEKPTYQPNSNESIVDYEVHILPEEIASQRKASTESPEDYLGTLIGVDTESDNFQDKVLKSGYTLVAIPIYIGVGMRLTAEVRALQGGIALSSLSSIGVDAEAKSLTGTLTVQTIGLNGKPIATTLPLPSKLDQTTIENGILAIGTDRSQIYSAASTDTDGLPTPRIVGLYSGIGTNPRLINQLYSELSRQRPTWYRPCGKSNSKTTGPKSPASDTTTKSPAPDATVGGKAASVDQSKPTTSGSAASVVDKKPVSTAKGHRKGAKAGGTSKVVVPRAQTSRTMGHPKG